ncbi:acyltransferase family protein [Segatella bryantii]|uniref:acyltransferase family protein n=1 Tax=Segatella bryantii TaxID=77095 RepID=UPI0039C982F0
MIDFDKLSNLKFILTCLIVYGHVHNCYQTSPVWYSYFDKILNILSVSSVPSFFSISAILFFRNFDINLYYKKVEARLYSLLIPYICFSIIGFILIFTLEFIKTG